LGASEINRQIMNAMRLGLREVKITGGEPLLEEQETLAILEHAVDSGLTTTLETNATLLTNQLISRIHSIGTAITTSLDGACAETHDLLRRGPGGFRNTLDAICALTEKAVPVQVICCIWRGNVHEIGAIVQLCSDAGVASLKFNFPPAYGRAANLRRAGQLCSTTEIVRIVAEWDRRDSCRSAMQLNFDVPRALRARPLDGPRCDVLRLISVLPDGRYSLCGIGMTHSQLIFGALCHDDIDLVWRKNATLAWLRTTVLHPLQGLCAKCNEYSLCQGHCRAHTLSHFGSVNQVHPLCQDAFEKGLFPGRCLRKT
jgi:radical SAM protein with 4Fe4S-binding SPASM domain